MAALTIVAANVAYSDSRPQPTAIQVGEAVTQGDLLRKGFDTGESTSKYYLCNNSAENEAKAVYIALTPGSADDFIAAAKDGEKVVISADVVVGETYFAGNADGDIMPDADLTSGKWITQVGYGVAANTIIISIKEYGVQVP